MSVQSSNPASSSIFIQKGLPALVVAPMEGVTDAPMRAWLSERGGWSYCVSEFVRVSQDVLPAKVFRQFVPEVKRPGCVTASGLRVQVQLLGGHPERLAESALKACEAGAQAIDLNFGCPAPVVNRHDGGATLLKFPERIREIVSAVRARVPRGIPVSAKLRLGWDDPAAIDRNAEMAALGGASWITIHGRTKVQGYTPPAYWEPIGRVRRALDIPVVANGEIWSLDDFRRCQEQSGCEHFMLGRGALAHPGLVHQIAREIGLPAQFQARDSERAAAFDPAESRAWIALFRRFAEICAEDSGARANPIHRIKHWMRLAAIPRKLTFVEPVKRAQSLEEIYSILEQAH